MATKFLDYTGLNHLWSKFKEWCNATFAAITHNQASNTINAMTGYSKPSSGSAIATSDSLNSAIGKLEVKVDIASDDSNYVHLNNNETIIGSKKFTTSVIMPSIELIPFSSSSNHGGYIDFHYNQSASDYTSRIIESASGIISINNVTVNGSTITGSLSGNAATASAIAWSGITSKPTTIAGYSITDAKIDNGTITLGSNSITPLTSASILDATKLSGTIPSSSINDSDYVHKTGNETITGIKTFSNPIRESENSYGLILRNPKVDKGTLPSSSCYNFIAFLDNEGIEWDYVGRHGRTGMLENTIGSDGTMSLALRCYKNDSTSLGNQNTIALICGFDENNTPFSIGASTPLPSVRNNDRDIITRDFIPKDTRIVHTTSDETINGSKQFNDNVIIGKTIQYRNSTITKGTNPSNTIWYTLAFCDKNGYGTSNRFGMFESYVTSNGDVNTEFAAYSNVASSITGASIGVRYNANGTTYAYAPSTPVTRTNGNDILTRDWIPKDTRIVHTTGNENIAGEKTFIGPSSRMAQGTFILTRNDYYTRGQNPSGNVEQGLICLDKTHAEWGGNGEHGRCAIFMAYAYTNGTTGLYCNTYKNEYQSTQTTGFSLQYEKSSDLKTFTVNAVIRPNADNSFSLGDNSHRFTQLFAATSTIATSDERIKDNINDIPDEILNAWEEVKFNQFKFKEAIQKKGESARFHTGVIAQRIKTIFESHNLNPFMYGLLCYDEWDNKEEIKSNNGEIIEPAVIAGNLYSIRYEECLCMEAAYQRRKNKILEDRISELEKRLAKLEGIV